MEKKEESGASVDLPPLKEEPTESRTESVKSETQPPGVSDVESTPTSKKTPATDVTVTGKEEATEDVVKRPPTIENPSTDDTGTDGATKDDVKRPSALAVSTTQRSSDGPESKPKKIKEVRVAVSDQKEVASEQTTNVQQKAAMEGCDEEDEDEELVSERGRYTHSIQFFFLCVGYSVSLSNVWHFPYLVYLYGGAFLIPYLIFVLILGLPVLYLELLLGQFVGGGANIIFPAMAPIFSGIGWGMISNAALVAVFHNVVIAWAMFYFFSSFRANLLWSSCRQYWNTNDCYTNLNETCTTELKKFADVSLGIIYGHSCYANNSQELQEALAYNDHNLSYPAKEFFNNRVVKLTSIDERGTLQMELLFCLMLSWFLVFLALSKGLKSISMVLYVTVSATPLVLIAMLIRSLCLPGALDGLATYMKQGYEHLLHPPIWHDAASHVVFSIGLGLGCFHNAASYAKLRSDTLQVALIIISVDTVTSILAGTAVLAVIGFLGTSTGLNISNVIQDDQTLTFTAYPEALSRMGWAPFWSALFFLMMFAYGIGSQFLMTQTVVESLFDKFPALRKYRIYVSAIVCILLFLLGTELCHQNGSAIVYLMSDYCFSIGLLAVLFLECVVVSWVYGRKQFGQDVSMMFNLKQGWFFKILGRFGYYWQLCWAAIVPTLILLIIGYALCIGLPIYMLIGLAVNAVYQKRQRPDRRWRSLVKPTTAFHQYRDEVVHAKEIKRERQIQRKILHQQLTDSEGSSESDNEEME